MGVLQVSTPSSDEEGHVHILYSGYEIQHRNLGITEIVLSVVELVHSMEERVAYFLYYQGKIKFFHPHGQAIYVNACPLELFCHLQKIEGKILTQMPHKPWE